MKLSQALVRTPFSTTSPALLRTQNSILSSNGKRVFVLGYQSLRLPSCACSNSGSAVSSSPAAAAKETNPSPLPHVASNSGYDSAVTLELPGKLEALEEGIEKVIYRCRFMAILGVFGSLTGSFLCFIKGCTFVTASFMQYFVNRSKVIQTLIEAIDVYLLGTVMLVFGMGLYELFVSNLGVDQKPSHRSSLFGLFTLKERPKWLDIKTVDELKTKLGHVIVMLLLIGLFDKSKKAAIHTPVDLLCFCVSVLLSSSCLFLLSKLN
ncbi:hypothetical protein JHK82_025838 [Glycine max]|uniref:Uncharacterized protein n=3 Tax=Glycine subgen. Soja TaxID=1462606 RepID=I1L5B6_SOYBN|nr:uncharacterized protein LOC100527423 [Glycine max]XP_028179937.1 uncharacterized protein LOC114367050 [Glycine soja]XP_028179938.1 uncharacterized protein LOC114367050 [Glycine soja]KAG4992323.1 hypothetical protein JHK87_025780 [Glycine soja]KAG5007910.1 hypothetical protein JHK85_026452 [Glycine max]KAG5134650.1 hypothetical protein JHK82_025838 [Glycine max]KAH1044183.1 hypothetical protein GYH30_025790 [Glycine max]KRH39766.1 hypothetical protein GLYMA_09G217900v4 [Glycine max]|eukprot:NP_001235867.2 uncharacterized protein LOC100527423 [Glycine max]